MRLARAQVERDLRNKRRELRVDNISCDRYRIAPEDVATKRQIFYNYVEVYFSYPLFQIGSYCEQYYCHIKLNSHKCPY
jgi:hypothetical protein